MKKLTHALYISLLLSGAALKAEEPTTWVTHAKNATKLVASSTAGFFTGGILGDLLFRTFTAAENNNPKNFISLTLAAATLSYVAQTKGSAAIEETLGKEYVRTSQIGATLGLVASVFANTK